MNGINSGETHFWQDFSCENSSYTAAKCGSSTLHEGTEEIGDGYYSRNNCVTSSSRVPERQPEKLDSAGNEVVSIDPEAGLITGMDAAATTRVTTTSSTAQSRLSLLLDDFPGLRTHYAVVCLLPNTRTLQNEFASASLTQFSQQGGWIQYLAGIFHPNTIRIGRIVGVQ